MATLTLLLDALFALGGIAAFGFLAWGARLAFLHSRGFVAEGEGRFRQQHRRRGRGAQRLTVNRARPT